MSIDVILVDIFALLTVVWIVWYFWLSESQSTLATAVAGVQESTIRVKGGHDPDRIEVRAGQPVRLREEVTIELVPAEGEYEFTCQMGMLRGTLVARGNGAVR